MATVGPELKRERDRTLSMDKLAKFSRDKPSIVISGLKRGGRMMAMVAACSMLVTGPVWADNQMGYQVLSQQAASGLPHNHGSLGMDVERAEQINDNGMAFDLIRVKAVRRGSPGAQAGFSPGDQIVAVDGRVFATLTAFASYIGSVLPGKAVSVDYIPANGGPAQAQRIVVTVGSATGTAAAAATTSGGLSTGTKIAIGVGAAALFGCYELGCFSRKRTPPATTHGSAFDGQLQTTQPLATGPK